MENELIKIEPVQTGMFANKDAFEHAQRVATMFAKSDLVPKQFQNNVGNCVIALEMATRIGASPLAVMQNLYIVHGKPSWASSFLIATINACGKFSPLRYEHDEKDGGRCRAYALDLKDGEKLLGSWVSMNMAKAEGWVDKAGSKWKTMPELMMKYRAASFFARQYAPEVSMGIYTQEEIQDIGYAQEVTQDVKQINDRKEYDRVTEAIKSAKSKDELMNLESEIKDENQQNIFNEKLDKLK